MTKQQSLLYFFLPLVSASSSLHAAQASNQAVYDYTAQHHPAVSNQIEKALLSIVEQWQQERESRSTSMEFFEDFLTSLAYNRLDGIHRLLQHSSFSPAVKTLLTDWWGQHHYLHHKTRR